MTTTLSMNPNAIRQRERRAKHGEKVREYAREYCAKNKEQRKIHDAKYRAKHREKAIAYDRKYYQENKERVLAEHHQKVVWIQEYKTMMGCVDCGETRHYVLDLDHRDPSLKAFAIGGSGPGSRSIASLLDEIDKCDVRCANCHREKHWRERVEEVA